MPPSESQQRGGYDNQNRGGGGGGDRREFRPRFDNNKNKGHYNKNNNQNYKRDFRDRDNRDRGPGGGGGGGGQGGGHRNQQGYMDDQPGMEGAHNDHLPEPDLADIQLTEEEKSWLSSKDLKSKSITQLTDLAQKLKIENAAGLRRQDMIFEILKRSARLGVDIYGSGVLEILPDGYGFLRSPDYNYLPGPDDIYVSPSQIRRFGLRTG